MRTPWPNAKRLVLILPAMAVKPTSGLQVHVILPLMCLLFEEMAIQLLANAGLRTPLRLHLSVLTLGIASDWTEVRCSGVIGVSQQQQVLLRASLNVRKTLLRVRDTNGVVVQGNSSAYCSTLGQQSLGD